MRRRIEEGFRFIVCGIDTQFLIYAARRMLEDSRRRGGNDANSPR